MSDTELIDVVNVQFRDQVGADGAVLVRVGGRYEPRRRYGLAVEGNCKAVVSKV